MLHRIGGRLRRCAAQSLSEVERCLGCLINVHDGIFWYPGMHPMNCNVTYTDAWWGRRWNRLPIYNGRVEWPPVVWKDVCQVHAWCKMHSTRYTQHVVVGRWSIHDGEVVNTHTQHLEWVAGNWYGLKDHCWVHVSHQRIAEDAHDNHALTIPRKTMVKVCRFDQTHIDHTHNHVTDLRNVSRFSSGRSKPSRAWLIRWSRLLLTGHRRSWYAARKKVEWTGVICMFSPLLHIPIRACTTISYTCVSCLSGVLPDYWVRGSPVDPCHGKWHGVGCDLRQGILRVTSVDVVGHGLHGDLRRWGLRPDKGELKWLQHVSV